jgi:hypothetical protein
VVGDHFHALRWKDWAPPQKDPNLEIRHAEAAVLAFDQAIRLGSQIPRYHLGRASMLEQFKIRQEKKKWRKLPPVLAKVTHREILTSYWNAFSTAFEADSNSPAKPRNGDSFTSDEAGYGYIRVAEANRDKLSEQEGERLSEIRNGMKQLNEKPDGESIITPIILCFDSAHGMDDLLAPERVVQFDLRGYGPKQSWTWVKPDSGFLVWDPERSGVIESGQQMFGSYTWQIFWRDGYEAMSVLDADGNGILEEAELERLSVWFDRDGNGVSGPGEVVPVKSLGIAGLRTQATSKGSNHVSNPKGLILQGGRELPTWDWLTSPIEPGIGNPKP